MTRISRQAGLVAVAVLTAACAAGRDLGDRTPPRAGTEPSQIAPAELLADTNALSDDALEGRAPGSVGDRRAREILASRLAAAGAEPGFDGSWEQPFDIVGVTTHLPALWGFRSAGGREGSFRLRDDFIGASGLQSPEVSIENAEVVFGGYGIRAPEERWDDFKDADLGGKLLLLLNDDPDWDPGLFAGERKLFYGRWTYKFESAARAGAAGAILIHTTPSAGYPWDVVLNSWSGEQFALPAGDAPRVPLQMWMTEAAASRLVALSGRDLASLVASARSREFRPVPLGVTTSIRAVCEIRKARTANVAGFLRGSDPAKSRDFVVLTAHHDHLGVGSSDERGDRIYNGALDNSVAMAQVLAIARRLAAMPRPPARSFLLLFPAAEEQGLLGSSYFARSGRIPPARIAADINFELGNVWGRTRDVVVFGMGKSTLEDTLSRVAKAQGRTVHPEKDVRAGWFYRSDGFSFARAGVPAIWFRSGTDVAGKPPGWGDEAWDAWIRTRYHRPSDEVSADWDLEGLAEDARLGLSLAIAVGDAATPPAWYPGDEFESQRRRSLAAGD